jgi:hypothetical protein
VIAVVTGLTAHKSIPPETWTAAGTFVFLLVVRWRSTPISDPRLTLATALVPDYSVPAAAAPIPASPASGGGTA